MKQHVGLIRDPQHKHEKRGKKRRLNVSLFQINLCAGYRTQGGTNVHTSVLERRRKAQCCLTLRKKERLKIVSLLRFLRAGIA